MSNRFSILLDGDLTVTERVRGQVAGSRVLAADGGMRHAAGLGVMPELWLGDFDSADAGLQQTFGSVPRQDYPSDKDATDGELAIDEAVRLGAAEIVLVGGLGGQMDHALAHMMLLLKPRVDGLEMMMTSGHEEAWPLRAGSLSLQLEPGTRLSVLPVSDLAGLGIEGVRWPLDNRDVPLGSTLTLSNEAVTGQVTVSLEEGRAIVLVYPRG